MRECEAYLSFDLFLSRELDFAKKPRWLLDFAEREDSRAAFLLGLPYRDFAFARAKAAVP